STVAGSPSGGAASPSGCSETAAAAGASTTGSSPLSPMGSCPAIAGLAEAVNGRHAVPAGPCSGGWSEAADVPGLFAASDQDELIMKESGRMNAALLCHTLAVDADRSIRQILTGLAFALGHFRQGQEVDHAQPLSGEQTAV